MDLRRLDRKYFGRQHEPRDVVVGHSADSYLIDSRGRRYIDFMMGWCAGNLGWGNTEIRRAASEFDGPDYVHPDFLYRPWVQLAEMLARMTPGKLAVSYRTTGGTESVDGALQIAMAYTGRGKFVSIKESYHGNSIAAMSIGAQDRDTYKNLLPNCHQVAPPLDRKALARVEARLEKRDVAAFIMEPIVCNLAARVPDEEFVRGVRESCTRYGTLFIADEVATGFGRTGKLFACEHFGLEPDILCVAKAITGGYGGLGAVVTTPAIAARVKKKGFGLYSTYGWHPRAVAVAIANLRHLNRHRVALLKNANRLGDYLRERLAEMPFKSEATVQGKGLAIGIEFEDEAYASRIGAACRKRGLLVSVEEEVIMLFPALTTALETAERAMDIFEAST